MRKDELKPNITVHGPLFPEPVQVILSRIDRFLRNPEEYFTNTPSLPPEDREIVIDFLTRMTFKLRGDKTFYDFVKAVAGKSIRNALLLAQGQFELPVGEMKRIYYTTQRRLGYRSFSLIDGPDVVELKRMLHTLGYWRPSLTAFPAAPTIPNTRVWRISSVCMQ